MKLHYKLPMYYGASAKLFAYAKSMRYAPTETEKVLWNILNAEAFTIYKFRRQHLIIRKFYKILHL